MNLLAADMERCLLAVSNGQLTTKQITDALVEWQRESGESLLEIVRRQTGVEVPSGDGQDVGQGLAKKTNAPALPQDPFKTRNASDTDRSPSALIAADTPASHDGASLYQTRISSDLPSSSQPVSVAAHPAQELNRSSRFEIVRQHARGGLGEVFVAQDHELDREVAVKQILAHHRYDAECRSRFVLEAQITGRLEHPGIVPVYGLGNDLEGRLYYAMRFIQGESLQQAIDHFYKDPHTDVAIASLHSIPFRKLLTRFSHVCNIVEYAHAKGILHRDIKPANIMLGKYDETLLVDWGLAKVLGTMDPEFAENPMATKRISGIDSSQTRYGAMVGTPAFMSPEQAKGLHAEVDSRSDIYSLGATLYCLLTGRPPFGSSGSGSYLEQVKRGEFTPPRQVRGHIPKPLEAICMKAMAVQPASRYQHAADIAEDIDRWLADEPISTYAETGSERIGRWIRHNRSLLMFGIISMILLTIGSIGAFVVVNGLRSQAQLALEAKNRTWDEMIREKENAIQMRQLAEESRIAAETASQRATEARELSSQEAKRANELSDFLLSLFRAADPVHQGRNTFSGKPASVNLTARDLLDRGATRLTQQGALLDSPLSRASVLSTIGDVYRQLSLFADAEPLLVEALSIRRQNNATEQEIIESEFELAALFHEQGDYDRGREHYQVALSMQEKQVGENAELFLASILNNFGWMLANEGGTEEGKKLFLQAAAIRERKLGSQHRDTLFSRIGAAFCMIEQHRYAEALPIIVQASQSLTKVDDNHNMTQALTHFGTGLIYRQTLGNVAAEREFRETIRLTELELGANNVYLALARFELAATLADLDRDAEAMEQLEICLRIARESVQLRHPRIRALISLYSRLMAKQGKQAEAESLWQDFLTAQRTRFGMEHRFYYEALLGYTIFLRKVDRDAEAIELYQKILEGVSGLQFSQKPWLLAMTYSEYSSVLCELDRFSEALGITTMGIKQFEAYPELIKDNAVDWMYLHADLAECYIHLEDGKAAEQLEKALGLAKKITTNDRAFATQYVLGLSTSWHLKRNDYGSAVTVLNSRKALARQVPKEMLSVAKDFLRCCRLVEQDADLASEDKERMISEYSTAAVETLRVAVKAGLTLKEMSVESKLFDRIREREEFRSLLVAP